MEFLDNLLGLNAEVLSGGQMVARATIIFFISLILIRISGIRTLGKQSAFDTLTTLILGSILGRVIVANQPFFGTLLAALMVMLLHRLLAWMAFRYRKADVIINGETLLLMKNGKKQTKNLSKCHITDEDIMEALRRDVNINSIDQIKAVYLERSGDISIVKE